MDPNEALRLVREAAGEIVNAAGEAYDPDTSNIGQLIESFDALDKWLSKGGALPLAWEREKN
jgi:hypothetical protein